MSLSARLTQAVETAFSAVGDLVKVGTLSSKSVTNYDFATQSTVGTTVSIPIRVIITTQKTASGKGFTLEAIMKSGVDMSVYDTLTVDSINYNIVDYTDNGYIIEAVIVREK